MVRSIRNSGALGAQVTGRLGRTMTLKTALLGSALIVAAFGTAAAGDDQAYVGLEGGLNLVDDVSAFRSHTGVPFGTSNVAVNFDSGWAMLATVGYSFADAGMRIEGEAGYRSNKMMIPTSTRSGDFDELTLMLNIAADVKVTPRFALTLGAGVGGDKPFFNDGVIDDEGDWRLAYQGIAGLRLQLAKRVDLALNYRYLRVDGPSFGGPHGGHSDLYTLDDLDKHTVTLGFVFGLGAAEPPPPPPPEAPPPPPPPPRDFTVYFDKKCNLTADANAALTEAGSVARQSGSAVVRFVSANGGAADEATSACRFRAAKANLLAKGIPEGAISQGAADELRIDLK
jgi:opacity protein-like surface antigen